MCSCVAINGVGVHFLRQLDGAFVVEPQGRDPSCDATAPSVNARCDQYFFACMAEGVRSLSKIRLGEGQKPYKTIGFLAIPQFFLMN